MLKGFREFIMRGNVVDLAIAVIIGAAFGAIVQAFASDFIGGLIGAIGKSHDFSKSGFPLNGSRVIYGTTINAAIYFLIVAAVIYFAIVLPMNKFAERRARGQAPADVPPTSEELLTEIRDLLRAQAATDEGGRHESP